MGQKEFKSKKKVGPKKIGEKIRFWINFWSTINSGSKTILFLLIFLWQQHLWVKNVWANKKFGWQWVSKTFWSKKISHQTKNLSTKSFMSKNILGKRKLWVQKYFGQKSFGCNNMTFNHKNWGFMKISVEKKILFKELNFSYIPIWTSAMINFTL